MNFSVPPIVRGEFVYRDVLLVDVGGDGKRHPRAAESEIKAILAGKAKDMVGHWWEAQLIHYGLNRSKVKDTCKVRLQQAIGQGKVKTQPPHLSDMEGQMKKEYAAAVRRAKAQSKPQTSAGQGIKRGREDENESSNSKKTKISVKVNGVEIEIDQSSSMSKKQKTTKAAEPKKNGKAETATKAETLKKSATTRANQESSTAKATPAKPTKSTSTPKATATSQKTKTAGEKASGPSSSAPKAHHPDNVFQIPPTNSTKNPVKREPKVKPEPGTSSGRAWSERAEFQRGMGQICE